MTTTAVGRGASRELRWALAGALSLGLVIMWARQITQAPIVKDASQTLQMGINLAHYGTFALESDPPLIPTNYREPLPAIACAAAVAGIDAILGRAPAADYFSGRRAEWLKFQNVAWLALFSAAVFWVALRSTSSFYVALISVVLVNVPLRAHGAFGPVDDLLNEIPSLGWLVLASYCLALAFARRQPLLLIGTGLLFGALALTKAINFFVFLALAGIFWFAAAAGPRTGRGLVAALRDMLIMVCAFALIVGPYLFRNYAELGTLQIAQRSGEALFERSLEDEMTADEMRGAVYWWAPHFRERMGAWLGYSSRDLLAGGRLQRLDDDPGTELSKTDLEYERAGVPGKTVTFYRKARAERVRIESELAAARDPQPEIDADARMKGEAVAQFEADPLRHLTSSVLFFWRGTLDTSAILAAALIVALYSRRYDLAWFVLPSLGAAAAYVFATPFFPRYDVPMHFVAILTVVLLAHLAWNAMRSRRQRAGNTRST